MSNSKKTNKSNTASFSISYCLSQSILLTFSCFFAAESGDEFTVEGFKDIAMICGGVWAPAANCPAATQISIPYIEGDETLWFDNAGPSF